MPEGFQGGVAGAGRPHGSVLVCAPVILTPSTFYHVEFSLPIGHLARKYALKLCQFLFRESTYDVLYRPILDLYMDTWILLICMAHESQ
jgi:hypothetical protein